MEENKDLVVLVGTRALIKAKTEFLQFIHCSPLYSALAICGLLLGAWLGILLFFVAYFINLIYQAYTDVTREILSETDKPNQPDNK